MGCFWLQEGSAIQSKELAVKGGVILALATLIGALFQWIIQLPLLIRKTSWRLNLIWDWRHPGAGEVLKIISPAILSCGMLQINVFTDLFFASGIIGAAAGLSYANFLIQAPLGIISNALLIPLLPTWASLTNPSDHKVLIRRIRQGLMYSSASMIAIGSLFITLATPIVALVYARGAFDSLSLIHI